MAARIPRFTLEGVPDAQVSVHPFTTEDGLGLELTRFHRADCDDVVVLLHGLPASRDMFIMPEHYNIARFLLDAGFTDVWALDFRMSNRFPYDTETHRFTLDDIAHWDYPAAFAELRRHIGDRRVHVVAQCLGSVSFMMSLSAGAVDGITSVVSNSVALTPRLPSSLSRLKLAYVPWIGEYILGYSFLDPRFGTAPRFTRGWMFSKAVSLTHRECDQPACHMISFMWSRGKPGLWHHDNLEPVTHERIADLFSACGMNYYRHMNKMVKAGHAVKGDPTDPRHADLPDDYLANAKITTPVLFLTGDDNRVFADSNIVCHAELSRVTPGIHELAILPGYGHVDPFIGKNAHLDVFPKIVDFLKRKAAV